MNDVALLGAGALHKLLAKGNVRPKKRYGQNFVIDPNTIRKVLEASSLDPNDHVLEVGAGVGSLTLGLASQVACVTAVEVDERLLPLLNESVGALSNVRVVHEDVMRMDLSDIDADAVVSNLPYNLAASIVLKFLFEAPSVRSLTVMAQKEVGERLVAGPGSKIYGQTSVLLAFHAMARVAATISRNAFYPVPEVDSVLVRIDRRGPPDVDEELFGRVVRAAFAQRRKTLRNSLSPLTSDIGSVLKASSVAPDARAEDVGLDGYVALTRAMGNG